MSVKVALCGVSGYAKTYVCGLTRLQDEGAIDFVAAVIRNPAKEPETVEDFTRRGIRLCRDTAALYRECPGIDLMCIPTGIASHEALSIEAMEHGCDVLVEKPLCGCMESARRILEAEKRTGRTVMVGYQHIYLPGIQKIKKHLLSGRLGGVRRITAVGLWPRGDAYYSRNAWAGKLAVNGVPVCDSPVNNAFAHYLNVSLFFAGRTFGEMMIPVSMRAEMYRCRTAIETFDNCAVKVSSADGVDILAFFSHTCPENFNPAIRVECEKGSADWKDGKEWCVRDAAGNVIESETVSTLDRGIMFNAAIARLADPGAFVCTARAAAAQTFCIDQLHRNFRISQVPQEFFSRREEDGVLLLKDVQKYCFAARDEFRMPSEAGAPWSVPSETVKLEDPAL
ncbi:MAG: Gfo/Idh/MocA family oxidoreductase [Lentisphaeria bacterium]|nr:Gfo/Idh/MocA family oxidoreductase [Lentisphaeria bacterium]